jgi:succinyl-diaminopimelate desuccinylase
MGHNAIHDASDLLQLLASYQPQQIEIDGLVYREGLNAVMISGGIAGNVIPDRCVIDINYRFAPDKSPAEAEAYVRGVLDGYPIQVTDVAAGARPGLNQPEASRARSSVGLMSRALARWVSRR